MEEWNNFKIGDINNNTNNYIDPSCIPFDIITHTTHIEQAIQILKERKIIARLVYDESRLNNERILVVWLSPNYWANGSRYGNISFEFNINDLITNKKIYWIEVGDYKIQAPRILLTNKEYNNFQKYNSTEGNGPWFHLSYSDRNEHYRNGNYTLEIMLEEDLPIYDNLKISFTTHHNKWCAINRYSPNSCKELGLIRNRAIAKFISGVISNSLNIKMFTFDDFDIQSGLTDLYIIINNLIYSGNFIYEQSISKTLANSFLSAYYKNNNEDFKNLAGLFKTKQDLWKSCFNLIKEYIPLTQEIINKYDNL